MELPTHREADREGNESLYSPNLNFLSVLWQPPPRDRVGQPVGGWLPSKSEKLRYASVLCWATELLKAEVSQSYIYIWYDSECLCQFRGTLCQWCNTYGLQITHASGSQSFSGCLSLFMFLSYSRPLLLSLLKCRPWSLLQRTNVAVKKPL